MLPLQFARKFVQISARVDRPAKQSNTGWLRREESVTSQKTKCSNQIFRPLSLSAMVLLAIVVATGCDSATQTVAPLDVPAVDSGLEDSASSRVNSAVSDDQAAAFADDWLEAILKRDPKAAGQLIAWKEILERSVESFNLSEKNRRELIQGAMTALPKVSNAISDEVHNGGDYRLVHIKRRNGYPFALFRVLGVDGSFNYNMFRIRMIRGKPRADQFFSASTGEEMSDTFRNLLAPGVQSMSLAGRITGTQQSFLKDLETQNSLTTAIRSGNNQEALKIYNQMPPKLQKTKMCMLYRIMATPVEDEAAYSTAIDEYLAAFPGDAAVGLITLDAGAIREDAALLNKSHQSLTNWTGGDPYLDLIVGANLAAIGENDAAVKMTDSVDPATVGVDSAHDFKLAVGLAVKDYAEVLKQLRVLRDNFGYEFVDLSEIEEYKDFADSPEYEQWEKD